MKDKHKAYFLWSQESSEKYQEDGTIDYDDFKEYSFKTEAELDAFLLGVDEAEGWSGFVRFDSDPRVNPDAKALKIQSD